MKIYSLQTSAADREASGTLPRENPQTYPQEMWITRALRFC
jgi:hypothetical protein